MSSDTTSSSDQISDEAIIKAQIALRNARYTNETVLVAPNEHIATEWKIMFPGVRIIMSERLPE